MSEATEQTAGSGAAAVRTLKNQKTSALLRPAGTAYGTVAESELAKPYDVVIIGGGPAGVAAAQQAAFLGRRALLIDDAPCEPTELDLTFGAPTGLFSKALRDTAKQLDVGLLSRMGLDAHVVWAQVQSSVARLAANNARSSMSILSDFKVDYLRARARLDGGECVVATRRDGTEARVATARVLVATGSLPTRPDTVPFDDARVFDSDSIAKLQFLPKRVVIAGAGIIAIEYAKIFAKLQCEVSMLVRSEAKSSLARIGIDGDIAQSLLDDLAENNVNVLTHTSADSFDVPADVAEPITITLKGKDCPPSLQCDIFLAAMGRKPSADNVGLVEAGATLEKGAISVDENFHVNGAPPSIFAAGDVLGAPALASTGVEQAKAAVGRMFDEAADERAVVGRDNFPVGVWTIPEIGYYGLSKAKAAEKGIDAEEGVAPYTSCLRGRVFAPQGFLKLVFDRADGRIVGVHIFGTDACELIHFGMELVNAKRTIFDVMSMLFTAVTFHELFKYAALSANSKLSFGLQWRGILKELGAAGLSASDTESLRAKFDALDTDQSGSLDADELAAVFSGVGKEVSKGTLSNMLRLADEDKSGSISFDEFAAIIAAI